jgi:Secretion system C-terminal sorting domain
MKTKILLLLLLTCILGFGQQKIRFDYDAAGNQIVRDFCLTCLAKTAENTKDILLLKSVDLQKFSPEDDFSYYPNPVKETLFLKWNNQTEAFIVAIKIFDIHGAKLKSFENQEQTNNQNISFMQYPAGIYIISLTYNNGEEKTIKIVKQ